MYFHTESYQQVSSLQLDEVYEKWLYLEDPILSHVTEDLH